MQTSSRLSKEQLLELNPDLKQTNTAAVAGSTSTHKAGRLSEDVLLSLNPDVKDGSTIKRATLGDNLKAIGASFAKGISDVGSSLYSFADLMIPEEGIGALFGVKEEDNVVSNFFEDRQKDKKEVEDWAKSYTDKASSSVQKVVAPVAELAGGATPNAIIALMSGGLFGGKEIAKSAVSAVSNIFKTPNFWMSFSTTAGNSYQEALDSGASDLEATATALLNGYAGSMIEVGGGIETLPSTSMGIRQWVRSSLEEGGEEVLQGAVESFVQKIIYDDDKAWVSLTDPDAVFSLSRQGQEFLMGTVMGGIMGGGEIAVSTVTNKIKTHAAYTSIGTQYLNGEKGHSIDEAVQIGLSNAKGTDAYLAAEALATKVQNNEKVSAYEVGRMVAESSTPQARLQRELENLTLTSARENGVDATVAESIAAVSVRLGRPVRFAASRSMFLDGSDTPQAGTYNPQNGVVTLNADLAKIPDSTRMNELINVVLKHELMHSAERSGLGKQLTAMVRSGMGQAAFDAEVQAVKERYAQKGRTLDDPGAQREVVADWVGKHLFTNDFVKAVTSGNANVGGAFVQALDKVRLALGGSKKSHTAANIAMLERLFMRAMQEQVVLERGGNIQSYINPNFVQEYEAWDKQSTGGYFVIGTTSKALQSVGINPATIYWDKSKIVDILNNPTHYMEDAIVQVPELLEHPVVIMQSNTVVNRVVLLGDVYDAHGNPVLCALELTPKGRIQNLIKIASAYGKETGLQSLVDSSRILYLDPNKKRTDNWLQARRLQLPVGVTSYGSIGRVALFERNVKGQIEIGGQPPAKTPMQLAFEEAQKQSTNTQYMQDGQKNTQSSFYGGEDLLNVMREMDDPTVDRSVQMWDNEDRANRHGDLVNEYHDALTSREWSIFYSRLAQHGYLSSRRIGATVAVVVGNKLVVAERQSMNNEKANDFVVIDAYELVSDDAGNSTLWELQQLLDEGEIQYDEHKGLLQDFGKTSHKYAAGELLKRYVRASRSYDAYPAEGAYAGGGSPVYRDSRQGVAGGGLPLGDQPSGQPNYGISDISAGINESPTSQDGSGFFSSRNSAEQSSFDGSEDLLDVMREMDDPTVDGSKETDYNGTNDKGGAIHGEQQAETRDAFYRRAHEEKLEIKERGQTAFVFRRSHPADETYHARQVREELTKLGIPCVIVDRLEKNRDGITTKWNAEAATSRGDAVYANNAGGVDPKETAGHEAFHFWSLDENGNRFVDILQYNIDFSSDRFNEFAKKIQADYFGGEIQIDGDNWGLLTEEILAHISGHIHAGDFDNTVRPFLYDFDSVKSAWNDLVNSQTTNRNATIESPMSQDGSGFFSSRNSAEQSSFDGSEDLLAVMEQRETETVENRDNPSTAQSAVPLPLHKGGEGSYEAVVSQAQSIEELEAEIGEEAMFRRLYVAHNIERPPATVMIDGREVNSTAYMDEVYTSLPDDDVQLTAFLKEAEQRKAADTVARYERGETEAVWTEADLQILAARSKLEWSVLDPGEEGSKVRRFYEQRLKGKDTNDTHQAELVELLAGRSETYSPISNQKTLEKAKDRLRSTEYQRKLRKRVLRYDPTDMLTDVEMAAAQVMINDAKNDGDIELADDLIRGLARKGTGTGRALQVLYMQARMTPEGTLRAAQRTLQKQADRVLYDGASDHIDSFAGTLVDAIERATESKQQNSVNNDIARRGIKHPQYSDVDIRENMERVAQMDSVYEVAEEKLQKTGKRPSELFNEFFDNLGNAIWSEEFGEIALVLSSTKSEIRHGITAEKLASIEAIPSVIKNGKVIAFLDKGSGVYRIVVCAPIKIGEKPYYMGVMLQRDSQNQRLYLHNVVIQEEITDSSQVDLVTTGTHEESDNLYISSILRKALTVKNNTNKKRNTADRMNGLSRPKPNEGYAIASGISDNSVTQNSSVDNPQHMQDRTENSGETETPDHEAIMREYDRPMSREELTEALVQELAADGSPYITEQEIRGILERAVNDSSNVPEQLRRVLKKKLGADMGTLAQRIAAMQKAGHLNDVTMRRVLEETLGLPTLSTEDVRTLTKLVDAMNDAADGSAAQMDAQENIYKFLGEKLPVDLLDTLQAWRKFGMLFNLKTHGRNFLSNGAYFAVNKVDMAVAQAIEGLLVHMGRMANDQRTAALGWRTTELGQQLLPLIEQSAEQAKLKARGSGKYEIGTGQLYRYQKALGDKVGKLSDWNSKMLEAEDSFFFVPAYKDALGQILVARGITDTTTADGKRAFEKAEQDAFERAREAVFQADTSLSNGLAALKGYQHSANRGARLAGHAVDVAVPFAKTPVNIAYQSILHSPLGIAKGAYDLVQLARGKDGMTTAKVVNDFAKGITGSVLTAIGVLLGSAGLFNIGYGKTEKERAADELAGVQENSFQFGNVSISFDWLQPTASALIVGASIAQRLKEDGLSLGSVFGAIMDGTDSLFEMTMLQSLYDIVGGYDSGATATVGSIAENTISQSIPTVLGQIARAIDPVQRKTSGESALSGIIGTGDFAKLVQKVMARIPGLTYLLEPELDVWGNVVYRTGKATAGSGVLNALQQFILPANIKIGTGDDEYSQIVHYLYENGEVQPGRALPSAISREQAEEMGVSYVDANRYLGQKQYAALQKLINNGSRYEVRTKTTTATGKTVTRKQQKYWSEMTEEEQLQVLKRMYADEKEKATDADGEYYEEIVKRMG